MSNEITDSEIYLYDSSFIFVFGIGKPWIH